MGFFDKLTEAAFKEGANGETIYYPNGVIGKGRIIKDPTLKEKIFKYHKRLYKYLIPFAILYGLLMGLGGVVTFNAILPLLVITLLVFLRQQFLLKGLPKHDVKLTAKEASISTSKAMHPAVLIFMMLNGALCIVLSLLLPFLLKTSIDEIRGLMLLVFILGAASLAVSYYLYRLKKSNRLQ